MVAHYVFGVIPLRYVLWFFISSSFFFPFFVLNTVTLFESVLQINFSMYQAERKVLVERYVCFPSLFRFITEQSNAIVDSNNIISIYN
jgi:hypothetical protein